MEQILFLIILSLLLVHEMDAMRAKEWKMFVILKDMAEERGGNVFMLLHLPLYLAALYALVSENMPSLVLKIIVDVFLLCHVVLHRCFKKHPKNDFNSLFSLGVIYIMPLLAIAHLYFL